jgi:hypothetical protein
LKPVEWITIIGGVIAAIITYFGKYIDERIRRAAKIIFNIALLCIILITSYQVLTSTVQITKLSDFLTLLDKPTLFFLVILVKLVIVFWTVIFILCYFNPERITKAHARVGNVEIGQEFAEPEKIITLTEGAKQFFKQTQLISKLNRTVLDYIAQPFEDEILKAENKPDAIRKEVYKTLCKVYKRYRKIQIFVMELTKDNLLTLEPSLYTRVKSRWDEIMAEGEDIGYVEEDTSIGIAIHRGTEGLSSVIIIDATRQEQYELSNAELAAASTLFVAVSSIIAALEINAENRNIE